MPSLQHRVVALCWAERLLANQIVIEDREVDQFVLEEVDSVPHLEALLLLWNSRPQPWILDNVAKRLYVASSTAAALLQDLSRQGLVTIIPGSPEQYGYGPQSEEKDKLMARLDVIYRKEVVRISTLIHSKPSSRVRDFARAFRFTKERE